MSTPYQEISPVRRLVQEGWLGDLFLIHIVNIMLRWVTLNIYHFWGKTRIREYIWSHLRFENERFEYTGRGGDLFSGFLKAVVAMIGLIIMGGMAFAVLRQPEAPLIAAASSIFTAAGYFLTALASYTARGYLLSRTRWRGIRFSQTGSAARYAFQAFFHGLAVVATLGLYWPIRRHILLRAKIANTRFGTEKFTYAGAGRDLYKQFLMSVLLTLPTLGLTWFWYMARDTAYVAAQTRLGELDFRIGYTGGQLLGLRAGNLVITVLTLGFGYPLILHRNLNFLIAHLQIEGELDYAKILQSVGSAPSSGEGLTEIFGISGGFLGVGRI